ncbi:MAG: DUF481 domain-containing protein [Phycisphaeraceae bacterium]|nr:DUF481 domain-containing protein [Phycisphaeraceae bacterium]
MNNRTARTRLPARLIALAAGSLLSTAALAVDRVTLPTGETLTGEVVGVTASSIILRHPVLGDVHVDSADATITHLAPEEPPADGAAPDATPHADSDAMKEAEAHVEAARWKFKLVAGLSYITGNTKSFNVSTLLELKREADDMKTVFSGGGFYGRADGEDNQANAFAQVVQEWFFKDSPWLWFADARFDYDEFQSWRYRFAAHTGPGYKFFDLEAFKLTGLLGIGVKKEWQSDDDDWIPEGQAGVNGFWQITPRQKLEFSAYYYPDFSDFANFRTRESVLWSVLLDESLNLSLTAGLIHEYQAEVDPGDVKNDIKIIAGLQIEF